MIRYCWLRSAGQPPGISLLRFPAQEQAAAEATAPPGLRLLRLASSRPGGLCRARSRQRVQQGLRQGKGRARAGRH